MKDLFSEKMTGSPNRPFRILTVCTGNICRSPFLELLLNIEFSDEPILVESAGTAALVGHATDETMQSFAPDCAIGKLSNHRARQLTQGLLQEADLVLALDRNHRRIIAEMYPRAIRRAFTLREFSRLCNLVDMDVVSAGSHDSKFDALSSAVNKVSMMRGTGPILEDPAADDVLDPFRRDQNDYVRCVQQLTPAANKTAWFLKRAMSGDR